MTRSHSGQRADERSRGQALVEFALVAPLLFLLLIGIFEAGRFILNLETLNNATREGARYAVVHGARSMCPTGPMPVKSPPWVKECDEPDRTVELTDGAHTQEAVANAAVGIASTGSLTVPTPIWTFSDAALPSGAGDLDTLGQADNFKGNYVTVYAQYEYDPIFKEIFDIGLLPSITIEAESSLVINN